MPLSSQCRMALSRSESGPGPRQGHRQLRVNGYHPEAVSLAAANGEQVLLQVNIPPLQGQQVRQRVSRKSRQLGSGSAAMGLST